MDAEAIETTIDHANTWRMKRDRRTSEVIDVNYI